MQVEICVDSVEGAMAAARGGASRVELCDNLVEGGTTPSAGCVRLTRARIGIGLQMMVRPRGGDFLYSDLEMEVMREDIQVAKDLGADGVVFGLLTAEGDVDLERTGELMGLARPLSVTFHRAFDMCRDPRRALEELISLGVDRVLTSGQEVTCEKGLRLIAALREQSEGRVSIMPGGGIDEGNVAEIVLGTGVSEVHLSARSVLESAMKHRNERCVMGGSPGTSEYRWKRTDEAMVRRVVEKLIGKSEI